VGFTIDMNGVKLLEISLDHYLRGTKDNSVKYSCKTLMNLLTWHWHEERKIIDKVRSALAGTLRSKLQARPLARYSAYVKKHLIL
jgi:hypothetical protein